MQVLDPAVVSLKLYLFLILPYFLDLEWELDLGDLGVFQYDFSEIH